MATIAEEDQPYTTLAIYGEGGRVYKRDVVKASPRPCREDEVPVIDFSDAYGDLSQRQKVASAVRSAAENNGFFYLKNHGISEEAIEKTLGHAKQFFHQPEELKEKVSVAHSKGFNGWSQKKSSQANPSESKDYREGFCYFYEPSYEADHVEQSNTQEEESDDFHWKGTSHLPNFKQDCIKYLQEGLRVSRVLIKVFALSLDLPETYFDHLVTNPGSDVTLNFYPAMTKEEVAQSTDVGFGSHTDFALFTLLWQDQVGGLQVLTKAGEWVKVVPIPGTIVVNVADFFARMTNDRYYSCVHRVYNPTTVDRYSMPYFFGFNLDGKCAVLPSCIDENNPPKYEPITSGEWYQTRMQQVIKPDED